MSFSGLMLPPPLPLQATTLMELWNHLTSTLASWKSTSARRTHQICKCSTAGTALAGVFGGGMSSNFHPRVLLYRSFLLFSFLVLPPASSWLLAFEFPQSLLSPLFSPSRLFLNVSNGKASARSSVGKIKSPRNTSVEKGQGLPTCADAGRAGGSGPG